MKPCFLTVSLFTIFMTFVSDHSALGSNPIRDAQVSPEGLPQVPAALIVPNDQSLLLKTAAKGSQIYVCQSKGDAITDYGWTLKAPSADLLNDQGERLGTHYTGPTWEIDRSVLVGVVSAKVNAPQTTAIPWLLLKAASHQGQGVLSSVNWIQRLDTIGGKAPAEGCDSNRLNAEVRVPYTANYYFYGAAKP